MHSWPFQYWRYISPKHTDTKTFKNYLNPVMLVFIGKLLLSTSRWVTIRQGFSHFSNKPPAAKGLNISLAETWGPGPQVNLAINLAKITFIHIFVQILIINLKTYLYSLNSLHSRYYSTPSTISTLLRKYSNPITTAKSKKTLQFRRRFLKNTLQKIFHGLLIITHTTSNVLWIHIPFLIIFQVSKIYNLHTKSISMLGWIKT